MKKELTNLICFTAEKTGAFSAIRHFFAKNKITIINSFISIDTAAQAIKGNAVPQLPPFPMVITFDDGHAGNYKLLPIFQTYNIPATIYVTSGLTGTNRHFWWKELRSKNLEDKVYGFFERCLF